MRLMLLVNIPNSGQYTWTPSDDLVGDSYFLTLNVGPGAGQSSKGRFSISSVSSSDSVSSSSSLLPSSPISSSASLSSSSSLSSPSSVSSSASVSSSSSLSLSYSVSPSASVSSSSQSSSTSVLVVLRFGTLLYQKTSARSGSFRWY